MNVDIDALYKNAPAVLWVEDRETKAWLEAVWQGLSPNILVRVAGGHLNVEAVCEQAIDAGWAHVFGLVDQDFGTHNRDRWGSLDTTERVYRLDVHETENLLLDSEALSLCTLNTHNRTRQQIDDKLIEIAQRRAWWVACTRFLADTRRRATNGFPANPGAVESFAVAEAYVKSSGWFSKTAADCPALAEPNVISTELRAAHHDATVALTDDTWKTSFPGKQLFREISGYVQRNAKGRDGHINLVKSVGAWQRVNVLPPQASELRDAIVRLITPKPI
jgi:hypothetical protein